MRTTHQTMTEAVGELERSMRATIEILLRCFLRDDQALLDHVHRVAHLSASVALLCGAREPDVSTIEWAALLHHAGESGSRGPSSSGVVRPIVGAPHTVGGLELIRNMPTFAASAALVTALHKWHRRGLQQGKGAGAVPFGVRVIAVCDRFDELTAVTSTASSHDKAIAIVTSEHLPHDADIVDALCQLRGIEPSRLVAAHRPNYHDAPGTRLRRYVPKAELRSNLGHAQASASDVN